MLQRLNPSDLLFAKIGLRDIKSTVLPRDQGPITCRERLGYALVAASYTSERITGRISKAKMITYLWTNS